MEKLKNGLIGVLFLAVIILLLLKQCSKPNPREILFRFKSDTVNIIKIDTVHTPPTIVTKYIKINTPISSTKIDTDNPCNILSTYHDSLIDSNLTIITDIKTTGELKSNQITYKLFVPYRITKTVTNVITNTKTEIETKYGLSHYSVYGGLVLGGNLNSLATIQPFIGMRYKTTYLNYGYNIINSTHNVGVAINFFNIK